MKLLKTTLLVFSILLLAGCAIPQPIPTSADPGLADTTPITPSAKLPEATSPPIPEATLPATNLATGQPIKLGKINMINPLDGWAWAVNSDNSNLLVHTRDGGKYWKNVSPLGDYRFTSSSFLDADHAWLAALDDKDGWSILRTTNGGSSWQTLPPFESIINSGINFLSTTYGIAQSVDVGAGNAFIIAYETTDGGETWSLIPIISPDPEPNLPEGTIHLCNICGDILYIDQDRLMVVKGELANEPSGVIRMATSTDRGFNWTTFNITLPEEYKSGNIAPFMPKFDGSQGVLPINITRSNQDGTLEYSILVMAQTSDNGTTWQLQAGRLNLGAVYLGFLDYASSRDIFARCGQGLCYTNDGGQSFVVNPSTLQFGFDAPVADYVNDFHFVTSAIGYALVGPQEFSDLMKTEDAGLTWKPLDPRLIP